MTVTDSTLDRYGVGSAAEAPVFKRMAIKQSPHTGKIAGFTGRELNRGLHAYATRRRQRGHFYRKGDGYAISDSILREISKLGVTHVFVPGPDASDDVLEFVTRQYVEDGEAVPEDDLDDKEDPQTYIPAADAREIWPDHAGRFWYQSFDDAMDRIDWRGYDARRKQ